MAGQFLTHTERERYEYVPSSISPEDLNRYFYLSDSDIALIKEQRGNEQRLGFASASATSSGDGDIAPKSGSILGIRYMP